MFNIYFFLLHNFKSILTCDLYFKIIKLHECYEGVIIMLNC